MKANIITSSVMALAAGFAANAAPVVSDVSMSQDTGTTLVTVKYRLSGEPGVITLDIQTNYIENAETKWASIGPENMRGFGGDVHQVVQPTTGEEYRMIYWSSETYWPGPPKTAGTARAVVTAWATNAPPDYMIVHLVSPYDITYYPYVEMVPGGITNIMYKGEYMPFRKIPAKGVVWLAGMPANHACYHAYSKQHRVMLNNDYYMAVYELSVAQKAAIDSGVPTDNHSAQGYLNSKNIRGNELFLKWPSYDAQGNFDWENSHYVRSGATLGVMRDRFGLEFDLPTEHQWEYACRAGSPGTIYTDTLPTIAAPTVEAVSEIAQCRSSSVTTVGSFKPNAWGLYDMLGNVHEICLDWYGSWETLYPDDTKVYVDPVGPAKADTTGRLVARGYYFSSSVGAGAYGVTIGGRYDMQRLSDASNSGDGVRICVTLR